jgi:hypothetical protein
MEKYNNDENIVHGEKRFFVAVHVGAGYHAPKRSPHCIFLNSFY